VTWSAPAGTASSHAGNAATARDPVRT
jgi:hypothetical protein